MSCVQNTAAMGCTAGADPAGASCARGLKGAGEVG